MKAWDNALLASFVFLAGACTVPNESSIHILGASPLTPGPTSGGTCTALNQQIIWGSLDIGAVSNYLLQFAVENNLQSISTVVPPDTVAGPSRNTFFGTQILYSYSSTPPLPSPDELQPVLFVLPPGSSNNSWFRTYMLTANMEQRLIDNVRPGDSLTLNVTLQVQGALGSGQKINTNKVTFPIEVYNSGFPGCPAGDVRVPSGPCGLPGGQDGTLVGCCRSITPKPAGCPTGP